MQVFKNTWFRFDEDIGLDKGCVADATTYHYKMGGMALGQHYAL